jgi:hypothetical protein
VTVLLVWLIQSGPGVLNPGVGFEFVGNFADANPQIGGHALFLKEVAQGERFDEAGRSQEPVMARSLYHAAGFPYGLVRMLIGTRCWRAQYLFLKAVPGPNEAMETK